jgi:UDP-N-acetylmuramate--alanine ligase
MFFRATAFGADLGEFVLHVSGEHNCVNALGAIAVALEIGLPIDKIKTGLQAFTGTKRRMELVGTLASGALLYDDYAHHPTEITKTLSAFRAMFPKKQLLCIFQPHTYSRTKVLFDTFVHAFAQADRVIIMDIFASAREAVDETISSRILAEEIQKYHRNVLFLPKRSDVVQYLNANPPKADTIVITMGAGDVYKIANELRIES